MKNVFTTLLIIILSSIILKAQITITNTDVANSFSIGKSYISYEDMNQTSLNIGNPGGGNNWDFSNYTATSSIEFSIVDPLTTPFHTDFENENLVLTSSFEDEEGTGTIYSYFQLSQDFYDLGSISDVQTSDGNFVSRDVYNPPFLIMKLPLTYNLSWSQTSQINFTTIMDNVPIFQTTGQESTSYKVDAYGTLKLPGGLTLPALRIKEDTRYTQFDIVGVTYDRMISYTFQTKEGHVVSVTVADTLAPDNGVVGIEDLSWTFYSNVSSVEQTNSVPSDFNLKQNYPNPFNPETVIEYSLPKESFVQLKIYDILGNEITALVNETQAAGSYKAVFDASNLSSGIYLAVLKSENSNQSIKMTLIK